MARDGSRAIQNTEEMAGQEWFWPGAVITERGLMIFRNAPSTALQEFDPNTPFH
jgi:hypothetical protein